MSLLDKASLIVTPNGYKEGKLYSVVPSDGTGDMNVVRATTATRVNSSGLIEIVPKNLLTYSEQFDNAAWSKISVGGASVPVVTSNSTTAPNDNLTADKIVFNAPTSGDISIIKQNISLTGNANGSIYIKAFSSGDIGKIIGFRFNADTYGLITLTDSWQRFSVNQVALESFDIHLRPSIGTSSGSVSVYVWGAQLEQNSTATEYFPTTDRLNVPRIDYTNESCPSLLVEPQRTNLSTFSDNFTDASWVKLGTSLTVTANTTISPDGTQNADTLNVSNNDNVLYKVISGTFVGNVYNFTIYAKGSGTFSMNIRLNSSTTTTETKTLSNQWQRFNVTVTNAVPITTIETYIVLNTYSTYNIWGAQIEAGSYPTSYIPTVASSVTRNADVISKTGISSLIGQTEGTMFAEVNISNFDTSADQLIVQLFKNSTNRFGINIYRDGANNKFQFFQLFGGSLQVNIESIASSGVFKLAGAYKNNDYIFYINGVQIGSDTSASVPDTSEINIGSLASGNQFGNRIKSVQLYKTRLTNSELAQLTTL